MRNREYRVQEGQLSVALLLSDLNEVKEISSIFRKLGIIPHFYEDLKTFMSGTLERIPSLCIVDVKLMSEGEISLHEHPAVKEEKMPLVFFYSVNTEPLILSTYDFFHLGVLKKSEYYEGQLRALLKRLNHYLRLERDNASLKKDFHSLDNKINQLEMEKQAILRTDLYQNKVKDICLQLEDLRGESDFFVAVEKVLQGIDEISEFAVLELSFNGQKLMSPLSHVQKFRMIPSLWLGQKCSDGIELFAQNMATQVAMDIMGGDLVSLSIKGHSSKPDKLMFIKSKNELFYNQFDWNLFEAFLNGFYATFKNKLERNPFEERKVISSFEAMSFLDQFLFGGSSQEAFETKGLQKLDYRLINVDFKSLLEVILKKASNRFYWNKFEKEFINKLEIQSRIDFKVFEFGVHCLGFLIQAKDLDLFFNELKEFSTKFSYWKYFEDSEGVLAQVIKPKVAMVPLSAYAYLKASLGSHEILDEKKNEGFVKSTFMAPKDLDLIWDRESEKEMKREHIHEV